MRPKSICVPIIVKFSASSISSAVETGVAPSRISASGPRECGEKIEPGTAKTSRFCSTAKRAVIIAPLLKSPSTIRVPSVRPDMMRLRRGKYSERGFVPSG